MIPIQIGQLTVKRNKNIEEQSAAIYFNQTRGERWPIRRGKPQKISLSLHERLVNDSLSVDIFCGLRSLECDQWNVLVWCRFLFSFLLFDCLDGAYVRVSLFGFMFFIQLKRSTRGLLRFTLRAISGH
jgi:hypothetical protein